MQKMPAYFRSNDLWSNQMSRKRKRDDNDTEMSSWFRNFRQKIFGKEKNEEVSRKVLRVDESDCKRRPSSTKHLTSTPKQKRRSLHTWFKLKDKQIFSELIQKHLIDEQNTPQTQSSTQTDREHSVVEVAIEATAIEKTIIECEDEKKRLRKKCEKGDPEDANVESLSQLSLADSQKMPESVVKVKQLFAHKSQFLDRDWLSTLKASIVEDQEQEHRASQEHEESLKKVKEESRQQKEKVDKVLKKRLNDRELHASLYSLYISPPIEEEKEDVVVITDEMNKLIDMKLRGPGDEILVNNLKRSDLHTLLGLNWLNDEVINEYFSLIERKCKGVKCLSTFFYRRLKTTGFQGVKRWTKKFDLFSYSLVLIPLHLQVHWTLISISVDDKTIHYYDSMSTNDSMSGQKYLETILSYLKDEYEDKKRAQFNVDEWKLIEEKKIPLQLNGSDCGMFCCKYAYYLSIRKSFSFHQSLMPLFRRRMIYELITQTLL